jgi:putative Mg2+ transporter-C (MgtC) family protein
MRNLRSRRWLFNAMELNPPILVHWVDIDLLSRLGIAAILGLLLGVDREFHDKAAGLRTHGLICFSAAAMTVSILALNNQVDSERTDVLRIYEAAGAYIGIIGAGLIIFSKGRLRNLTTAAHLWLTAVVGIACGAAQWPLVVICSLISVLMLTVLGFVEGKFFSGERPEPDVESKDEADRNQR